MTVERRLRADRWGWEGPGSPATRCTGPGIIDHPPRTSSGGRGRALSCFRRAGAELILGRPHHQERGRDGGLVATLNRGRSGVEIGRRRGVTFQLRACGGTSGASGFIRVSRDKIKAKLANRALRRGVLCFCTNFPPNEVSGLSKTRLVRVSSMDTVGAGGVRQLSVGK